MVRRSDVTGTETSVEPNTFEKLMKIVDLEGREIATYYDAPRWLARLNSCCPEHFIVIRRIPPDLPRSGADDDGKLQFWIAAPR